MLDGTYRQKLSAGNMRQAEIRRKEKKYIRTRRKNVEKRKGTVIINGEEVPTYYKIWLDNLKRDAKINRLRNAVIILALAVIALGCCLLMR